MTWGYLLNWRDVAFELVTETERTELFRVTGQLASLNLTGVIDRRDSPFDATRGWLHSSSLQWGLQPLGSDFSYLRYLVRQFGYQPVGPLVLAGGVRWGSIWALDGPPPLTAVDLFFTAGGTQTVRGYADESLSAVELVGVPVGGPELLVLNGEIRFPIFKWFKGVLFADAGNTFTKAENISFDALAVGAGFGLRINTPLAIGIPLGGVWFYYGRWLTRTITEIPDTARRAGMRRLYFYILSAIGLGASFTGLGYLLSFLINRIVIGTAQLPALTGGLAAIVTGLPLWLLTWLPMQTEALAEGDAGDHARRSLVRRIYLYLALFISVVAGMVVAGNLLFQVLRSVLGQR